MSFKKISDFRESNFIESNWNIQPREVIFIEEGDSTENWKVLGTNGELYVLRNAGNFPDYVRFQCDILNFLLEQGFPYRTPLPIRTNNGNFSVVGNGGCYILYRYIDGEVLRNVTPENAYQLGLMLAEYHNYINGFSWQGYRQLRSKDLLEMQNLIRFVMNCKECVERKTNKSELDATFLSKIDCFVDFYRAILQKVDSVFYQSLPKIPCHGDFERRNIIVDNDRVVGFIDLGGVTIDPAICDLQSCIHLNSMSVSDGRERQLNMNLAKAIVTGYISKRRLNRDELKLIPSLMYTEMLRILSWVVAKLATSESRVSSTEALSRIEILPWIWDHYSDLVHFFSEFSQT